jgi:hypothetical protein
VIVIAACAALVLAGIVAIVRWGGAEPPPRTRSRAPLAALARYAGICVAAGLIAGVLAAGAGGRIVMRLLALTSEESHGLITEAGERIGEISAGGTIGFILFAGLPAGLLAGVVFALTGPLLPRGRMGGLTLGAILLVLFGTRVEPMLADNFDFELVGPDWLSVLSFTALGIFQGMVVVALASRLSRGEAITVGPRSRTIGRVVLALLLLAALPGFVSALAEIL